MSVDSADGAPDISLQFGSGGVDRIPEVDLVGQLREGGHECLDGGVGADRRKVLKFTVNRCFYGLRKAGTHGKGEGDNT